MDNNTESDSRRLGAAFIVIGWIAVIALTTVLLNHTIFGTKKPSISETDAGKQITIERAYDSHFRIKGAINGVEVTLLIDTGASSIAVSQSVADRAHLVPKSSMIAETAGGDSQGFFTTIDELIFGGVTVNNVSAIIIPDLEGNQVLLGMNVLQKFTIQQTRDTMVLTVPLQPK